MLGENEWQGMILIRGGTNVIITDITAAIDALDFYDRMYLGQFDEITKAYRYHGKKGYQAFTEQENILLAIRSKMMPDIANLGFNCSRGIYCPETPKRAVYSHDINTFVSKTVHYLS